MSTYPQIILGAGLYQYAHKCFPGFTTDGHHVPNSWHYRNGGSAVDFDSGTSPDTKIALVASGTTKWAALWGLSGYLYKRSSLLVELFSTKYETTTGRYVKNGSRKSYSWAHSAGLTTLNESQDHIHVAIATEFEARVFVTVCAQAALGLTQDGVHGPKTTAAIKAVQKSAGISEDGVVGKKTVAAIRAHNDWKPLGASWN